MITSLDAHRSGSVTLPKKCGNEKCSKIYKTLLKCSQCHLQTYCGVDCQRVDWASHKKVCQLKPVVDAPKEVEAQTRVDSEATLTMIEKVCPISGLRLFENFIPADLHNRFIVEMNKGSAEMNHGHYDGYDFEDSEAFDKVFYELTKVVFARLKSLNYFSEEKKPLKLSCSLIGYKKDGFITPHIDSPLRSGGTVIIISFNSAVVVNFYSQKKAEKQQHKIFIPPMSMYSISGEARYEWSHAILSDENSYNSKRIERGFRYAMLLTPPGPLYMGSELLDY